MTSHEAFQGRQGDVLLYPIDAIPSDAAPQQGRTERVVLAYGEATGHHHALTVEAPDIETFWPGSIDICADGQTSLYVDRLLRIRSAGTATHDEHGSFVVPAGDYAVMLPCAYTPEELIRVTD